MLESAAFVTLVTASFRLPAAPSNKILAKSPTFLLLLVNTYDTQMDPNYQ